YCVFYAARSAVWLSLVVCISPPVCHTVDTATLLLLMASFLFHATAPPATYTLSLHDALPIYRDAAVEPGPAVHDGKIQGEPRHRDRKSTRLNSSHGSISYAVFCLKKKTSHRRRDHQTI